ncbi:MAG: hypothetical protein M3011_13065 [Actinomycetota bacterium]|nr:hypothetical protein [Actinomycetota bacterium]
MAGHLDHFVELRNQAGDAGAGLEAVLEGYALLSHETSHQSHGTDLVALVHRGAPSAEQSISSRNWSGT